MAALHSILKDFANPSLVLLLITLRIHIGKNIFELKSTTSLLNFDTKTEASTPVINVIHDEFKRYPEFNKPKVWGRQIFIRYNMIPGKKHQKPSKCCWFAFICTKTVVVYVTFTFIQKFLIFACKMKQIQKFLCTMNRQKPV